MGKKNGKKKVPKQQDLTVEDYLAAGVSRRIVMTKHPLEHTWTFWYQDSRDSKISWEEQVKMVSPCPTHHLITWLNPSPDHLGQHACSLDHLASTR